MKSPKIQPILMSGLGLVIAPLACGLNAGLAAFVGNGHNLKSAIIIFLIATLSTSLICFPLGLLCESIVKLWNSGNGKKARWLSAIYGVGALYCAYTLFGGGIVYGAQALVSPSSKQFLTNEDYIVSASLLIPFLWALSMIFFAVFARPPKN